MLRPTIEADLPFLFAHQQDPLAHSMAVFTPRDLEAFMEHWRTNVLGDSANVVRTIDLDGFVAGYIATYTQDGRRMLGYWIDRALWGRGITSAALAAFIHEHEPLRPLFAIVATSNFASQRVLRKCGFMPVEGPVVGPDAVEELVFGLSRAADPSLRVRDAAPGDAATIATIYNHYVADTIVTFEETAVATEEMQRRIDDVRAAGLPWLVAEREGRIIGYAYATRWRTRAAYRHSVEISVYLDHRESGRGVGSALYDALFARILTGEIHAVIGGISLPNEASVALHEKFGMKKVAHFEAVGRKRGIWIDVGYWQRVLK
jgi:L-amino acid N-acyltransferase YncA